MMIYIENIALALTAALTITAFWIIKDLHKDSKEFYRRNKPW
jgi:hypothetical protein